MAAQGQLEALRGPPAEVAFAPKAAIDLLLGKRLGFTQFRPSSVLARTVLEGVESRRLVCASMIMAGWPFKIFLILSRTDIDRCG